MVVSVGQGFDDNDRDSAVSVVCLSLRPLT